MPLQDIGNIYNAADTDAIFVRFQGSACSAANDIKNEATSTPNYAARQAWADVILWGDAISARAKVRRILRYSISTNSTFQTSGVAVTDTDINFMMSTGLGLVSNL